LGNLFSIRQACHVAGVHAELTSDRAAVMSACLVILPGVGAFADAMQALRRRDLVGPLRDYAASGRHLFGICLGMQLLMDESYEFGTHAGLGLVAGSVERLPARKGLKVPQIGWSQVRGDPQAWVRTPLAGIDSGRYFYFVHSYHVVPNEPGTIVASSRFGDMDYCSAIRSGSIFGVQFHPERSGPGGLAVYANLRRIAQAAGAFTEAS
jgi:glutamine amidotransferase